MCTAASSSQAANGGSGISTTGQIVSGAVDAANSMTQGSTPGVIGMHGIADGWRKLATDMIISTAFRK